MPTRRGMALIMAVLLAAIVMLSIVSITSILAREKTIVTSEHGFKDALAVAEAGMAQTIVNMQSASSANGWSPIPISGEGIFTSAQIHQIATTSGVVTIGPQVFPIAASSPSTLSIKVQKVSGGMASDGMLLNGMVLRIMSLGELYVNHAAAQSNRSDTTLVGRRVLSADYQLVKKTVTVLDYAMFTGAGMVFKGNNSHVYGGNVFSNGDIDLQGKGPRLDSPYVVYSAGTVKNAVLGENVHDSGSGQGSISLVPPTLDTMRSLAYEFRTGTGHYSAKPAAPAMDPYPEFPSTALIQGYFNSFLGGATPSGGIVPASTLDQVSNLTTDLVQHPSNLLSWIDTAYPLVTHDAEHVAAYAEAAALTAKAGTLFPGLSMATYYVETDKNLTVGTLSALGTVAVLPELSGGKRELKIAGGADIGSLPYAPSGFSMIVMTGPEGVKGDIVGRGNNATTGRFTGQIVATGDFNGAGNYTVNGQIIVQGSITLSGDFNIHYISPTGGTLPFSTLRFDLMGQSWREGSLSAFIGF